MTAEILYCGDTELSGAACYLAGLMDHAGWSFDYVPSHIPLTYYSITHPRRLYIFSDYPAMQAKPELQHQIVQHVEAGAGLIMIGGWESFHGLGGDWDQTPIGQNLGVEISTTDDRCNSSSPALLTAEAAAAIHPITRSLPWTLHPPTVGGWNRVVPTAAQQLLTIRQFGHCQVSETGELTAQQISASCGLAVQSFGQGRVVTFLSDIAPHWVGGFVDWGDQRVTAQAAGAPAIEVGNWYAQFWQQLLGWAGRLDRSNS
ncbi:hypothetical protein GC163_11400 [bacterium]|nr:hypothetical protein [bacterium]